MCVCVRARARARLCVSESKREGMVWTMAKENEMGRRVIVAKERGKRGGGGDIGLMREGRREDDWRVQGTLT